VPRTLLAACLLAAAVGAPGARAAVPSVSELAAHLRLEYGNPLAGVVHIVEPLDGGRRSERWIDLGPGDRRQRSVQGQRHVVYDSRGRPVFQHAQILEGADTLRYDVVDYATRTWTTFRRHVAPAQDRPLLPAGSTGLLGIAHTFASMIGRGELRVIGPERLDGRRTIHVRRGLNGATLDLWIDPLTYLVVSELASTASGLSADERAYVRRTPGTLAKTRVIVPGGFRHRTTAPPASFSF
jgi:hypothetical protein